jgi:DNA-binding response OmpR family regulator
VSSPPHSPAKFSSVAGPSDRPTVLLIGEDPMADALAISLDQHGIAIERGSVAKVVEQVFVGAPDLVVLVGDAAHEDGEPVLRALAARPATAVVPVVVVTDDPTLEARLTALRSGAVGVIKKSASVDAMATDVAALARDVPSRAGADHDDIGEATVDEIVELFSRRLRTGILAVTAPGAGPEAGARVMLRGDLPLEKAVEELVESIRPLVTTPGQPLHVEFEERATGKLARLELDEEPADDADVRTLLAGRRLLLIERSPARADDLVQALRDRGAHVVVIDGEGDGIERARVVDPDVAIVDERGVGGWAAGALRAMRKDSRLRWASLLVVRGEELFPEGRPGPDVHRLAAGIRPLIAPEELIASRSAADAPFDLRLETAGPVRLLRALTRTGRTLHAIAKSPRATIEIDVAEGLVVGAIARVEGAGEVAGAAAIAALLALGVARVSVSPRAAPSVANIMAPVDDALAAADRESPPLTASVPPPSIPPPPRRDAKTDDKKPQSGSIDARQLLQQLETMLTQLRVSLPPPPAATEPTPAVAGRPLPPSKPNRALGTVPPPKASLGAKVPPPGAMGLVPPPARVVEPAPPPPEPIAPPTVAPPAAPVVAAPTPTGPPRSQKRTMMGVASPVASTMPASAIVPAPPATIAPPVAAPPPPPAPVVAAPILTAPPPVRIDDTPAPAPVTAAAMEEDLAALIGSPSSPPVPAVDLSFEDSPPAAAAPPTPGAIAAPSAETASLELELEPAPQRRRTGLWVGVGATLIVLLALGGGALYYARFANVGVPDPMGTAPPVTTVPPVTPVATADPPVAVVPPTPIAPIAPPDVPVAPVAVPEITAPPVAVPDVAPPPVAVPEVAPEVAPPPDPVVAPIADEPSPDEDEDEEAGAGVERVGSGEQIHRLINEANFDRNHGDLAAAESVYLRVLRIDYYNARAMAGLTRLHLAQHDPQGALVWARRLVAARPQQAGNHILLGDVLVLTGDQAGARRAWQAALSVQPRNRTALSRLGQ